MALDVADADALKRDMIRLLLKHPQGIKSGDFSGAFYQLHGHHPQLALHGYSSLKHLLDDMKDMVVQEKNSQATVIKLAYGANPWLDEEEGWDNFEEGWDSCEEAEDKADPCGPAASLDTDFSASNSIPQKLEGKKDVLVAALVPVLRLLRDHPKGLDLQTLTVNLKTRGFDLERFSQDLGYSGTVYCLLEMPGLRLVFLNGMEPHNCVVQLSSSPSLPAVPLSAGGSLHKPLSSIANTGTFPQHLTDTKPGDPTAPAKVLALITNVLKTYILGLQVKKLQEILLTLNRFDVEKFSVAQGYKDTLEFLERQMPELKIKYCENRCKCVVKQDKKKKQKNRKKTKECPAKVLELLTSILSTYREGLRVKKLQEFLLTKRGFNMEKFSIAQGYKDTLEFLEQMPELNIRYCENRLKCVVQQGFGGTSMPFFREVAQAGPETSAPLQDGLRSSNTALSATIPNPPSSKEQHGAPSAKAKRSSQPHSGIPAQQQSSACQFGGRSAAGELSCPTDAQVRSQSSLANPSPSEHLDELKQQVAQILARHPEGMSLFQFRAAYNTTYQRHLPLGNASSAKQRLLEMSDIVRMKGYGVQTLLLPVSPEEPPTNPGLPVFYRVENASMDLPDSLPKAAVRPAVVSKLLKTPMVPQPHVARPLASDHLRAPDIKENSVLPEWQWLTTPKVVAPLQAPVRPKVIFGGYPDSLQAEETAKYIDNPLTKMAVTFEPVVVPKSSSKPSFSKAAAGPVPQLHPSVPSTSTCFGAPGNQESSFLPESPPPRPPKPSLPVEKNVMARDMPGDNLLIPQSPVVFLEDPQVSRLNGIWTSASLAPRPTYLANPAFSVNIPVPSLFQPVLTNIVAKSQPVVYPPLMHLPDVLANPSLGSAPHQSVSETQLVSSHLAQPASRNRPVGLTAPVQRTEQTDRTRTADGLGPLQRASGAQGCSRAPGLSADGRPVSSPSVQPPSLQPLKFPSVQQPESVDHTWLSSMPHSSVPAADDSAVSSPSARGHSKPEEPARQEQYDAANVPVTTPRTPSSIASPPPASSSFRSGTESVTVPSTPLVSTPEPHHVRADSAVTSSEAQPSILLGSSQGSPISTAGQPSYVAFRPRPSAGYDTSRQSKPLPGISREGSGQDDRGFTLPDNQRHRAWEEPTAQPSALQNSPPRQSSDRCVIL